MLQIRPVPFLLFACTFSPSQGAEVGPSSGIHSRRPAFCPLFFSLFFGVLRGALVLGQEVHSPLDWSTAFRAAEPGVFEWSWRIGGGGILGGQSKTAFYGNLFTENMWTVGGMTSVEMGAERSVLGGLDVSRWGVGFLHLGAIWDKQGSVVVRLPFLQPAQMPLRMRWRMTRLVDLGRGLEGRTLLDWSPGMPPEILLSASAEEWRLGVGSAGFWLGWSPTASVGRPRWIWLLGILRGGLLWAGVAWGRHGDASGLSRFEPGSMPSP